MMQLIAALGLSKAEFERVCGLSNGYVNSIRNTIGSKGVAQIIAQFPQVNKTWLVFGEGEMFNGDSESHPENPLFPKNREAIMLPLVVMPPISATARVRKPSSLL